MPDEAALRTVRAALETIAHEVEGLFVGDSSALPNGLGGPNPTLTAQALATRTGDRILDLAPN